MINIRRHYFPISDDFVATGVCPSGQYGAFLIEPDDTEYHPCGYGHSRLAAIADLVEKLKKER